MIERFCNLLLKGKLVRQFGRPNQEEHKRNRENMFCLLGVHKVFDSDGDFPEEKEDT